MISAELENILRNKNILHMFFNTKSDANKYLMAEEQEDLEFELQQYINKFIAKGDSEKLRI